MNNRNIYLKKQFFMKLEQKTIWLIKILEVLIIKRKFIILFSGKY